MVPPPLRLRAGVVRLSLAAAAALCSAVAAGQPPPLDDAAAIRTARAASNQAIAAHDLDGIARHWLDDVHIVTSTSAHGTGPAVNRQRMAQQFARRPDTVYVRSARRVEVWAEWAVAAEDGTWTGRWSEPDGVVEVSGTYLAQWRKVDGRWRIQAELFVPTACRGSRYCAARP